MPSRVLSGTP